jgi:transposase-like protein
MPLHAEVMAQSAARKVLRPKGHFPNDDAVRKILLLAIERAEVKWKSRRE